MMVGVTFTKTLSERFDKRRLMIILSLVNAASFAAFYFTPADQYWLMVAINCFGMLASGPTPALVWSMYADTADYGEWKNGRRTTALVFSTVQFSHKLGLAVGAGLAGIILSWFGFVANEVQSATSMTGIRFMFSLFPATFAVLGVIAIYFYPIDSKMIARMESDLRERHDAR
jgi:GPH family glycoside/pentoside/hexuronide:cation symporter